VGVLLLAAAAADPIGQSRSLARAGARRFPLFRIPAGGSEAQIRGCRVRNRQPSQPRLASGLDWFPVQLPDDLSEGWVLAHSRHTYPVIQAVPARHSIPSHQIRRQTADADVRTAHHQSHDHRAENISGEWSDPPTLQSAAANQESWMEHYSSCCSTQLEQVVLPVRAKPGRHGTLAVSFASHEQQDRTRHWHIDGRCQKHHCSWPTFARSATSSAGTGINQPSHAEFTLSIIKTTPFKKPMFGYMLL